MLFRPYQTPFRNALSPQQSITPAGYASPSNQSYRYASPYQQQRAVLVPMPRPFIRPQVSIVITSQIRAFLIVSGLIYLFLSSTAIALEIATVVNSYWTHYCGIWAGAFLLLTAVILLIVACRVMQNMIYLVWLFFIALLICIIAIILSAVNISQSQRCVYGVSQKACDTRASDILKILVLIMLIIAALHSAVNLAMVTYLQRRSQTKLPPSNVPTYQY